MQVDKENLGRLSDQELFKALKLYGVTAGPVTATTRTLYEKKLRNAMEKLLNADNNDASVTNTSMITSTQSPSSVSSLTRSQSTRVPKRIVETIEPSYKSKELEGNNFEISISNGDQEPILKVNNPNASKIVIEKTTTTITTTPKQPGLPNTTQNSTTTTTTTSSDAYASRNVNKYY
jgi:hypothetical protein